MSRIANKPVEVPSGVEVKFDGQHINVKGSKGSLDHDVHQSVEVAQNDNVLTFAARRQDKQANALAGTTRAIVNNMVAGVSQGFEKKLELIWIQFIH